MNFKEFLIEVTEYEKDVKKTLKKLPKAHQKLVAGYTFKFQPGNALKGDLDHIGVLNPKQKTLTIAAPWNYGREFTFLHEIGHLIWSTLNTEMQNKWRSIVKKHPAKDKPQQGAEEYFSMSYASTYANNQISKFNIPEWEKFIKSLSK